jgi:hypothetical protein
VHKVVRDVMQLKILKALLHVVPEQLGYILTSSHARVVL